MLQFKQNDTGAILILTLSELVSIPNPYFLFVFTHVLTKDVVAFIKSSADDISPFNERYNKFLIEPSVLFAGKQVGEWHYKIHEQADNENLDPSLSGAVLEFGKMILSRSVDFEFSKYDLETSYKTYNG